MKNAITLAGPRSAQCSWRAPLPFAQAPSWTVPPESARCPSKWGAGDERGAGNHMKPQTVLDAVKLIKTGEVIELPMCLAPACRSSGTRRFDMHSSAPS